MDLLTLLLAWFNLGQNKTNMKQILKNKVEKIVNYIFICLSGGKNWGFLVILKTINQEEHYRKDEFWHAKREPQK